MAPLAGQDGHMHCRDDVDLVCIMLDAVQDCLRKGTVISIKLIEYSAQVEHPDRFELNSLTAKTEQSSRRD